VASVHGVSCSDDADGHAPVTFCRSGSKMSYARSTVGPSSMLSDRRLSSAVDSAANTPLASPLINSRRDSRELSNGFFRSVIHPSDHPLRETLFALNKEQSGEASHSRVSIKEMLLGGPTPSICKYIAAMGCNGAVNKDSISALIVAVASFFVVTTRAWLSECLWSVRWWW
jgi:hypothetical protein